MTTVIHFPSSSHPMLHRPMLISPGAAFWPALAQALRAHPVWREATAAATHDCSGLHIVVPTFAHIQLLQSALRPAAGASFIPPRIMTFSGWQALLQPSAAASANGERLMTLYAALRQQAWLKKIMGARRNTDLLPLAQTLLTLSDELTQSLLPTLQTTPEAGAQRWQEALAQLPPDARTVVSDEAQLVWSIWQSQLDGGDALSLRFEQMMQWAERASAPLVWVTPMAPDAFETAFLTAYAQRQPVLQVALDWRATLAPDAAMQQRAWPELADDSIDGDAVTPATAVLPAPSLSLCPARSMEDEAQQGAQTVVEWLQAGKTQIAVIAQDRVVARRLRALLERAQIYVADETGWKLSTTRAAAVIVAWFDVLSTRAETVALLDLLKSPFLFAQQADKATQLMAIETALRRANILGGWDAVQQALAGLPGAQALLAQLARQAENFSGRHSMLHWLSLTRETLTALSMRAALSADAAGAQVLEVLEAIEQECASLTQPFSLAEWRAFVSLQLESTAFVPPKRDDRVVMLPLNGARLRSFDAVLVLGVDAAHLPSQPQETLFFANAVRRELGLSTRESRQRQQLRDFAEVLQANRQVVLSWQAHQDGEANPVSPWLARLQLTLARNGAAPLPQHRVALPAQSLQPMPAFKPAPAAAALLPAKLSASAYNSLVACPYQFFATRMLGLSGMESFSEMPEKRDYGDWLHQILYQYHETVREQKTALAERLPLLTSISARIFDDALARNAAALGYAVRWQKAMPAYLVWANAREAEGAQFYVGERWLEKNMTWDGGGVTLHGRVDRIDQQDDGEFALLDYKTQTQTVLSSKIKLREDQQLAFYGLLASSELSAQAGAAHYVALEPTKGKIGDIAAPQYAEWQQALSAQIQRNMQAIGGGAALPASGIESICQYCEVRGLCRKGSW